MWYSTSQAAISRLIQQLVQDLRPRLTFLPAFLYDHTSLDPDGVHFLPSPGQHYVMYLIDSARYDLTHTTMSLLISFIYFAFSQRHSSMAKAPGPEPSKVYPSCKTFCLPQSTKNISYQVMCLEPINFVIGPYTRLPSPALPR